MEIPQVLPDILKITECKYPKKGIGIVKSDGNTGFLTYCDLLEKATTCLSVLQFAGMAQGDTVLLSSEKNEEIIPLLWACFFGGMIPVIQPKTSGIHEKIYRILGDPWIIFSHDDHDVWNSVSIPENKLFDYDLLQNAHGRPLFASLSPDDPALIQFSSDNKQLKGIMLTHANILSNITDISHALAIRESDIFTNPVPLSDPMGLFGLHLMPLLKGCNQYLMNPEEFNKIPDFPAETGTIVSATSISGQTSFIFGDEVLTIYGMAEATLAVTVPREARTTEIISFKINEGIAVPATAGNNEAVRLVNYGQPLEHCQIQIVDDMGRNLPGDHIGNIWVEGENVSSGYINDFEIKENLLSDGWLKTRDLGFLHHGNLFITGKKM